MKTIYDFSAHSAKGLGGANGSAVVPTASGSADVPVRIVAGLTPAFRRAAVMLLMMLLTATTAWAFKTETPTNYTVSLVNNKSWRISDGTQATAEWDATRELVSTTMYYYWKANVSHNLANGITIETNTDVQTSSLTNEGIHTTGSGYTKFTFTAPDNIAITNVTFKNISASVTAASHSASGTTYWVTLNANTTFTDFEVTYGYIGGSCGDHATWSLDKDDSGQYTELTIGGTGTMKKYYYETIGNDKTWRTDAPWDWQDLKSVTIENGITSIGEYAFIGCRELATVTIGNSVTTLGAYAFNACDALTQITLPASVSSIGEQCFRNSAGLQRVNIQRTNGDLITLGSKVFNGCDALKYIVAPTPALAVQYKEATNWSNSKDKLGAEFAGYVFYATNEGGSPAYAVADANDLSNLAAVVNAGNSGSGKTFCQTAKIDFDNTKENNYTPIGNANRYFKGNYDGRGHTISGIRINKGNNGDSDKYQGVFGWTDGATIRGITLADADITGYNQTGGIVGYNNGTVSNCHVAANVFIRAVQSNVSHHGGIVGQNEGTVSDCTSAATLTNSGGKYYGGIAGLNRGTLRHNLAIGAVVPAASDNYHGAICGENTGITLRNNYYHACKVASADVTATGVGCNKADVTSDNGAVPAFLVNLGNKVTIQTEMADNLGFTYGGNDYWRQGAGLTLVNTLGNAPEGYTVRYATTVGTINGSTLTVGSADATVTATFRSDGHSHSVSYMKANGTTDTYKAIALDGSEITLSSGWYFVGTNIHYPQTVTLDGDVTIILTDGCTMSVGMAQSRVSYHGIYGKDHSLSIYAQSTGESKGQLYVSSSTCGIFTKGLTINSGTVTSNSNSGFSVSESNLLIKGGKVTATGTSDYGISASLGNVEISGGIVEATGSAGNGICANSGKVEISGGKVEATGAAGNYGIKANNITLGWTNADDYIYANSYSGTVTFANGKGFADEDGNIYSGTYEAPGDTPFNGKTLTPAVVLADNADNSNAIANAATACVGSKTLPVQLKDRKLYKDGDWNTLCLPFSVGNDQATSGHELDGTPLEGAILMTLGNSQSCNTGFDAATGTLTLDFLPATTVEPGVPYIVKWPIPDGMTAEQFATAYAANPDDYELKNPVFQGVTVTTGLNDVAFTGGAFKGTYDWQEYTEVNKSILFLGTKNTLYYPQPSGGTNPTIGACRAYFELSGSTEARQFVLNFGEETGIGHTEITEKAGAWYTLDGVKLDGKPTKKGLYIHGGRKVVVP